MNFDCWKLETCTNTCPCSWYEHMNYLCNKSLIPQNRLFTDSLREVNTKDFMIYKTIKSNIVEYVDNGTNIDICVYDQTNDIIEYGIKLLLNYFSQISYTCRYETYGLFIDVPQYIDKLKDNITLQQQDIILLKQQIDKTKVVVFNNITDGSNFHNDVLYRHIETRNNNKLSTIIVRKHTTNSTTESIIKLTNSIKLFI